MWKRRRREPAVQRLDWPLRWRDAHPAQVDGSEAEIAEVMVQAADDVALASEIDRQRAWARLRAAVHPVRRARAWAPALAATVLALVAVGGFLTLSRPLDSGLRQVVLRPAAVAGVDTETAVLEGDVAAGTPIRTAAKAIATVDIGDVGVLLLQGDTLVAARPLEGKVVHVRLEQGELVAHLQHRAPLGLVVEAGAVEVKVTGTVFGVRLGSEGPLVRVWRGSVEVTEGGRALRVAEGQRYVGGALSGLTDADRLQPRVASLIGWPSGAAVDEVRPVPAVSGRPLPATAVAATEVAADPVRAVPEIAVPSAEPVVVHVATRPAGRDPVLRPAGVSVAEGETPSDREHRLAGLARGSTPEAATALFALAALRYDVLGDRAGAIRAWSEYVARFPGGPLVVDARAQLFEALLADGNVDGAVVQGREAVAGATGVERARLSLRLAETLHLRQSRPHEAVTLYEQVVAGGGAEADRAAYLLIDALQRAGRTADAHAALDRYLGTFPDGKYVREVSTERSRWAAPEPRHP